MRFLTEKLRFRLHVALIRFYWGCEEWLENCPHPRQNRPIFFIPLAIAIPLIISAASFAANLALSYLLAPKPKPQVRGKLTGDITLSDSIFGFPIYRIYGGRPPDNTAGGVEAGCNIVWMSDIRETRRQVPSGTGGGGKGAPKPPPNIQINYKVDIAGVVGAGRLRLLRMKWNEDTVYSIIGGIGGIPTVNRIEAEAAANTLSGGASIAADAGCSNNQKVIGIGNGGKLVFNNVNGASLVPIEPPEIPDRTPYFNFKIFYKSAGDKLCDVLLDGDGGVYTFRNTAGVVGEENILRLYTAGAHTIEFSYPTVAGPEIDCIDISIQYLTIPIGPTGIPDSLFPAEADQDNNLMPDPYKTDTNAFERYDGKTAATANSVVEIPLQSGASLAWYEGTATQPVDTVIDAHVTAQNGAGSTPAFRDTAYFRIQNLDFTEYGSIPSIRCVVENIDLKEVDDILLFEGMQAGLLSADFDLAVGVGRYVRGLFIPDAEAPAKAFEDLGLLHNLNFTENNDGKIVGIDLDVRTSVATISRADLGAYVAEESDEVPLDDVLSTIPEASEDLIRSLDFQFNNPLMPSDFTTDRRTYNFPYTQSQRKETKSVNITMLPEEVSALVKRELQKSHLKQTPDKITVPHKLAWLNAGDCVDLEIDGSTRKRRIEEKTGSAPGIYEMTVTDEDIYILADDAVIVEALIEKDRKKPVQASTQYPANTVGTVMDLPPLVNEHKGVSGVYVAACPKGAGNWKGCQVFRLKGVDYAPMVAITKPAVIGTAVNAVTDIPGAPGLLDSAATLTVDFFGEFNPTTVTSLQAQDGANPFLIGSEVCIVQTWTRDNSFANRWVGTDIYRAERNTVKKAVGHVAGERVVLLNDAVRFVPLDESEVNVARNWKFVTYGARIEDTARIAFTWTGDNVYNSESKTPVIGQVMAAEQLLIRIGVRSFTKDSQYRKIEVSANAGMSGAENTVVTANDFAHSVLPTDFLLTRASGILNVTKYVRVSHSSNGRDYTAASNVLAVTFADSSGSGGSPGSFSPDQDFSIEVS